VRRVITLLTLVAITGAVVLAGMADPGGSALRDRVALILQPLSADGPILPPGVAAENPEIALTALRALREIGLDDDIPPGSTKSFEDALALLADAGLPPQSASDLAASQHLGGARAVATPEALRMALSDAVAQIQRLAPTDDPNVASDRLITIRAARDIGVIPAIDAEAEAWCAIAARGLAADRLDVAALFAELAASDPHVCQSDLAPADQWTAAARRATREPGAQLAALAYVAPAALSASERASAGRRALEELEIALGRGESVPVRVMELAARLAGPGSDPQRTPELVRQLRRAVLLIGATPDQILATAWDRIVGVYVTTEVGLTPRFASLQPTPSSGIGLPAVDRLMADLGLADTGALPRPGEVGDVGDQSWLLAALSRRTGDCAYVRDIAVPAGDGLAVGRQLVDQSLLAAELERCALKEPAASTARPDRAALEEAIRRLLGSVKAATEPTLPRVVDLWAAAESACLLGVSLADEDRSSLREAASRYLEAFVGPAVVETYSPDGLYAALRLRHLADGCDRGGWWMGPTGSH
jgi:hypothetical protein